jgi:D-alanine--poly(phosphoribitol) ligase subunit 2
LDILAHICDLNEIINAPDIELRLLDSFETIQLVALEEELITNVSITKIGGELWSTPNKIITDLEVHYLQ